MMLMVAMNVTALMVMVLMNITVMIMMTGRRRRSSRKKKKKKNRNFTASGNNFQMPYKHGKHLYAATDGRKCML